MFLPMGVVDLNWNCIRKDKVYCATPLKCVGALTFYCAIHSSKLLFIHELFDYEFMSLDCAIHSSNNYILVSQSIMFKGYNGAVMAELEALNFLN